MDVLKVLAHPFNEVVLIDTFDELMQEIRSDLLGYVASWKVWCIWLTIVSTDLFT